MKQLIQTSALLLAILATTSCGHSKNSLKGEAFCSTAAFVDTSKLKPVAPETSSDTEFHKVAGVNVKNQHKVIGAYDSLRECYDHWTKK